MITSETDPTRDLIAIDDPRVLAVPVHDNGESLVTLTDISPQRLVLPSACRTKYPGNPDSPYPVARQNVCRSLMLALEALPAELGLVLIESYRDYNSQKQLFITECERLAGLTGYRGMAPDRIKELASHFVSDPDLYSPHLTGGALDVALFDPATRDYLDTGSKFVNDATALTNYPNLSDIQKQNRLLLSQAMQAGGFVNYPFEWWHFSLDEKYYAFTKGLPYAQYGPVLLEK
jgi:D-alanyl-D-alanine dipeptidase